MRFIETEYSKKSPGHYVPGIIENGMLYISGQLSLDPETGKRSGVFELEAKQALDNMGAVLSAAGLTKNDVVMCRVYIPDMENWAAFNAVYADWFGAHKCARAVVPTGGLHYGCMVEIEAIAAAGE